MKTLRCGMITKDTALNQNLLEMDVRNNRSLHGLPQREKTTISYIWL